MPISTNAPFNEFGQSQILRDIEQLYLALNGAGSGGPGDGQTQDQSTATSQDSGGVPDLSNLATTGYVDAAVAGIQSPRALYGYGTGSVTAVTGSFSADYSTTSGNISISTSGFTAPYSGIYTVVSMYYADITSWASPNTFLLKSAITAPYGSVESRVNLEAISLAVGAVNDRDVQRTPTAVWTGYMAAGATISVYHTVTDASVISLSVNTLHVSGITCNP